MAKVKCPKLGCRSTNCIPVTVDKKYKTGKGIVGGAVGGYLLGPVGAVAGLAAGANGRRKVKFVCQSCGYIFEVKM